MVKFILFVDLNRQQEIETFFKACQMHRDYYRGYPTSYHPLTFFRTAEYGYQCPAEMTHVYLNYPIYHVKYKQPSVLASTNERTSGFPALPDRSLAARYNKAACKAYAR